MTKGPVSGALVSACYKEREHGLPCLQLVNCTDLEVGKKRKLKEENLIIKAEEGLRGNIMSL